MFFEILPPPPSVPWGSFIYWASGFIYDMKNGYSYISHMHYLHACNSEKRVIFNGRFARKNFAGTRIRTHDLPSRIFFSCTFLTVLGLLLVTPHDGALTGSQYSEGPSCRCYSHSLIVSAHGFAYNPTLPGPPSRWKLIQAFCKKLQ